MRHRKFYFNTLTSQLLFTLVLVAFIVMILMVFVEVISEYKQKLSEIDEGLDRIPVAYIDVISYSLRTYYK